MSSETLKLILDDDTMTEEQLSVLLLQSEKLALNHHFWHPEDIPTEEEKEAFYDKYEFEIYDLAKAMNSDTKRDGLITYTELGITRQWGSAGKTEINNALSAIPKKAYVL